MAKNIEPTLKLISEYLKLKKSENFVIPEYQRSYSWDITQCDKLWQDLETFISSNASDPYFFGTIIIDCSLPNKFSLIDGQQRTTTFLLLLKALLLRLNEVIDTLGQDEDSEALLAGLKANRNKIMAILYKAEDEDIPAMLKDNNKLKDILILDNKSINELYKNELQKIVESATYDEAEKNIYKIPYKQKDNKYTNHFRNFRYFYKKLLEKSESTLNKFAKIMLNECQVIEIRSWQIEQAITMFNSLNSTGIPLSDADIISAQLYSKAGDKTQEFNEQWEEINTLANKLSLRKIVDMNDILQQFMYINRALNKEYINIRENNSITVDVTTPGVRRYYIEIRKELLDNPMVLCQNLAKIVKNWEAVRDFPEVKLLLKFNENAKLFLSSYMYRFEPNELTEDKITVVCQSLLKLFTVLELSDTGYSSSKFKTFLFSENIKLVDKSISDEEIKDDFNKHLAENWNKESLEPIITEYNKNLLVFLNDYLYAKNKGLNFDFSDSVNIEHIMPSSGRNITSIQKDAGITDKKIFDELVNKIGNKILLEEDINKSLGNDWFRTKKQNSVNSKMGYKDSRYEIALSISQYPNDVWIQEDIEKATERAVERIIEFILFQS